MKQIYLSAQKNFLRALIILGIIAGGAQYAYASHALPIVGLIGVVGPTGITISGSSDGATCQGTATTPYWMQVEINCDPNGFSGAAPASNSSAWGTIPWFHSILNLPGYGPVTFTESCVQEPYIDIFIPFAALCPGTTYYWRAREFCEPTNSVAAWMGPFSFVTPGTPPASVLSATANTYMVCPGSPVQLNATVAGGCPGGTYVYSWVPTTGLSNPNIANPIATPTANITYTVTVSGGCFTITSSDDTVQILMGPPPAAPTATGAPLTICGGQSSQIVLTGMGPNTIQWQVSPNGTTWFNMAGQTDDTLNTGPLSSTLYYQAIVTGTGWPGTGCGSVTSNIVQITVGGGPTASAGANQTVCNGSCANLTGTGGVTYSWMPGSLSGSNVSVCPGSTTTYTLTATDAAGCQGTSTVMVVVSNPSVNASPDVSICTGNSTILLASGSVGNTYSWTPSGTLVGANTANPTATPTVTTTYTVTSTNSFGCTDVDSLTVTVTTALPISVSNDTSMCTGGTTTLFAAGATSYTWQPGNLTGSSITVTPVSTTTYVITGNTNNCLTTDSVIVTVAPPPFVFAGPDFSICNGTQATLTATTTGTTYNWLPTPTIIGSSTSQNVVIAPTTNTSYTVTVAGANGCISTDTIQVTINPTPTVTATASFSSICAGGTTTLTGSGGTTYTWIPTVGLSNPNSGTTTATLTNSTTYQVVGTNSFGCNDTASVTVTVNPLPNYYLITAPTECGDSTGSLSDGGAVAGTPPFTYTVNSQTYTSLPITGLDQGTYNINVVDANGCVQTQVVNIGVVNTASVTATASTYFGVYPLTVNFTGSGTPGINNYQWSFGGTGQNSSFTYTSPGTYGVILTAYNDISGCAVFAYITITVVEQATIMMPNVFTPNADGTNDEFGATVTGVKEIKVEIFNRWGVAVYDGTVSGLSSAPQTVALWNGRGGSGAAADGVYYYIVTATGYDEMSYPYQGFVQLIKD